MCTAISYKTVDHYFGRNLDYEFSYNETVTITPRSFPLPFRHELEQKNHYAITGMAYVCEGYPLYYDAVNEHGLCAAGLNFTGNAKYGKFRFGMNNIAPFEFIPWVLCQCKTVVEARHLLEGTNLVAVDFNSRLPATELHWFICDKDSSLVVEPGVEGIKLYNDQVGVLTNNPPFPVQLFSLNNYLSLSCEPAQNRFCPSLPLESYSRGMGAIGLPGDLSSQSRYIRAAFTKLNSICDGSEAESVSQFFHILGSVEQQRGCVRLEKGSEITIYSSCCNTRTGVYYYKTYENSCISAVDLHSENLNADSLISYPLQTAQQINFQNRLQFESSIDRLN